MKQSVYEIVTDKVIDLLEQDICPWSSGIINQQNTNLISGKNYRGVNQFLLINDKFKSPYWLSFKQAKTIGGQVKKGMKSTKIVFWQKVVYKNNIEDEEEEGLERMYMRYYNVFNLEQVELPEAKLEKLKEKININTKDLKAEEVFENMPNKPEILIDNFQNRPAYLPQIDTVRMPAFDNYENPADYYATLFHELVHSTGATERLDREMIGWNKAKKDETLIEQYSVEELIAEMGSCFIMAKLGIHSTIEKSAAYIKGWKSVLKDNRNIIIKAAGKAQRAVDYIFNINIKVADKKPA